MHWFTFELQRHQSAINELGNFYSSARILNNQEKDKSNGFKKKNKKQSVLNMTKVEKPLLKLPENATKFRVFVFELTESKAFGIAILVVILLNTVMLVAQTSEEVAVKGAWYFAVVDNVFLSIYIVELILKLYALRLSFFKTGWNIMDFFIVVFTTADFLLPLIVQNVSSFDVAVIFRLLRMFRSIKALRALRVLRTIRFLKNLQVVMTTVLKSFRALSTIVMLQLLFLYMFAVIGRGLFYKVAATRFGTLGRAFFTLFQLITLDDWFYMYSDIVQVDESYGFIILYLVIYIVLENFIFMNLFVAVLVDNFQRTLTAAEEKKKSSRENKAHTLFHLETEDGPDESDFEFSDASTDDEAETKKEETIENDQIAAMKSISDFYDREKYSRKDRELFREYFRTLGSLEYNIHQMQIEQKVLDELVDITVNIPDVPEELI